jgi:predicted ATPase
VGRERELTAFLDQIAVAAAGQGRLVLVDGEPGIGKTLLVNTALTQASGVVLAGAGAELEHRLPFSTIHTCLEARAHADGRCVSVLALMAHGDPEYAVIEALLALVEDYCAEGPVVLAIDDAHWADDASILLLHRLGRIAGQLPLLLVAALRAGPRRPEPDALVRSWSDRGALEIKLTSLPERASTDLAVGLVGAPLGPYLSTLVTAAGGNPLYIAELLSGLASEGRLRRGPGETVDIGSAAPMPPNVAAAVRRRLVQLSRETRQVLQVAALVGTSFTINELAAVLARPASAVLGCVQEATDSGVLSKLPDRLAFHHPLVRTVLSDDLLPSARQALHVQIAQAFAERSVPERVVELTRTTRDNPAWRKLDRDPFLLETSLPGVFAAGDVLSGSVKRVASAAGEGSVAALLVREYLRNQPFAGEPRR